MDDYTKPIKVEISAGKDETSKKVIEEQKKENEKQRKFFDNFKDDFNKGFLDNFKKITSDSFGKKLGDNLGKGLNKVIDTGLSTLKNIFSSAWGELKDIFSFSTLSNERTRELAFGYGMSSAQAYGYSKASDITGIDLENFQFARPIEQEKFIEYMNKYSQKYSDLYDSGFFDNYLEFQYEMEDFQQEMRLSIVEFIMDNKDSILNGMKALLTISEFVINIFNGLVSFLGGGRSESARISATKDIINSYSTNNKNTNITVDNTFNGIAKEDRSWLVNVGQLTYKQLIEATK